MPPPMPPMPPMPMPPMPPMPSQPAERDAGRAEQVAQQRHGGRIAALHQNTLRGVAPPFVGMRESLEKRRETGQGERRADHR